MQELSDAGLSPAFFRVLVENQAHGGGFLWIWNQRPLVDAVVAKHKIGYDALFLAHLLGKLDTGRHFFAFILSRERENM